MPFALSASTCDWDTAIEEFLLDMEATRAKNTHIFYTVQLSLPAHLGRERRDSLHRLPKKPPEPLPDISF